MSEPSEQAQGLQKVIECDVCLNHFDLGTRKPKTLPCGHTFCLFCLENLRNGGTLSCPTCRTNTSLPHGDVGHLPTNFSSLSLLESLCEKCKNQPWSNRCSQCPKRLCTNCMKTHCESHHTDLDGDVESLRQQITKYQHEIDNEIGPQGIQKRGDKLITDIKDTYNGYIELMQKQRDEQVEKAKSFINKDIQVSVSWIRKMEVELLAAKQLLRETSLGYKTAITSMPEMHSKHKGMLQSLDELWTSKPAIRDVKFEKSDFRKMLLTTPMGEIRVSDKVMHSTVQNLQQHFPPVPNYKAAKFQLMIEKFGEPQDTFNSPRYITECPATGNIIVSDNSNHRIVMFDKQFQVTSVFGSHGKQDGEYWYTHGVAVNQHNQIFVSDLCNQRIQVTDKHGSFLRKFGSHGSNDGQFDYPMGLCFDGNNQLYVCNYGNYRIQVVREDGSSVRCWGSEGSDAGQFEDHPKSIAISPSGKAVVTDNAGNLYIFTTDGTHIKTIHNDTPPQNIKASGVAVDQYNDIIITDQRGYIVVMTEDGEVICTIGKQGKGPGEMNAPCGITVTKCGDILVCDTRNNRIQQFHVPKMVK